MNKMLYNSKRLSLVKGNLFKSQMQTLVNTINCVGVMGNGLAKDFKKYFPEMYKDYVQKCKLKEVLPGKPYIWKNPEPFGKWVLNFPTKDHWKNPSKVEWIKEGLLYFLNNYKKMGIKSIAFPALGCNLGGLSWIDIRFVMEKYLSQVEFPVELYIPKLSLSERVLDEVLSELRIMQNGHPQKIYIVRSLYPDSDWWTDWKKSENIHIFIEGDTKLNEVKLKNIEMRMQKKYNIPVIINSWIGTESHITLPDISDVQPRQPSLFTVNEPKQEII